MALQRAVRRVRLWMVCATRLGPLELAGGRLWSEEDGLIGGVVVGAVPLDRVRGMLPAPALTKRRGNGRRRRGCLIRWYKVGR